MMLHERFSFLAPLVGVFVVCLAGAGCKEKTSPAPRAPSSIPAESTPPNPHSVGGSEASSAGQSGSQPKLMTEVDLSGVEFTDESVDLEGIALKVPQGWDRQKSQSATGRFASTGKVQFSLAKAGDEAEDSTIAITHYPGMKGKDEDNLRRWYGQFTQPDGRPTAGVTTKAEYQIGQVSVTLVDIPGTMQGGGPMMGGGPAKENYRMLAAIINHPNGPHFFKLTGPTDGVERWKCSAVAFLKSVKISN